MFFVELNGTPFYGGKEGCKEVISRVTNVTIGLRWDESPLLEQVHSFYAQNFFVNIIFKLYQ